MTFQTCRDDALSFFREEIYEDLILLIFVMRLKFKLKIPVPVPDTSPRYSKPCSCRGQTTIFSLSREQDIRDLHFHLEALALSPVTHQTRKSQPPRRVCTHDDLLTALDMRANWPTDLSLAWKPGP